jgi:hypothetical protein
LPGDRSNRRCARQGQDGSLDLFRQAWPGAHQAGQVWVRER